MATATNIPIRQEIASRESPPAGGGKEFDRRIASISHQSAVYFAGTILTTASGFLFAIYRARMLGTEALGIYTLGMTLVGFLGLFNALGLPTAAIRFVAAYTTRGDLSRLGAFLRGSLALLTGCNLVLALLVLIVGPWLAIRFYHLPALKPFLWAFTLIMFFGVLNTFLGQVMAGYQDVARRTMITHFIGSPANIVLAVLLIALGFGLRGYLLAQVASALLVLALLARSVWKMTPPKARIVPFARVEKEVFSFSAAAFATAGLEFILAQADKVVLGHFLDVRQVGIYAVAMAVVGFVPVALQSVNQIFSPTIAELHALGNRKMLQLLYATLTKWILIFTIPLALTMVILARPLMGIFGSGFAPGAAIVAIGAVGQLFNCAVGSVGFLLLMSGNQIELIKIQAVSSVLMVVLNLVLVPRMGTTGAALATAVTVIVANMWYLKAVRSKLKLFPYNLAYLKLILPTTFSAAALLALARVHPHVHSWQVCILGLLSAYLSFLGVVWLSGMDDQDRDVARILWAKTFRDFATNEASA